MNVDFVSKKIFIHGNQQFKKEMQHEIQKLNACVTDDMTMTIVKDINESFNIFLINTKNAKTNIINDKRTEYCNPVIKKTTHVTKDTIRISTTLPRI